jgi:hypothetical protein
VDVFKQIDMNNKISETPERWVILKLLNGHYKVFVTWAGGYLNSDRWKLNSRINKVEQDEDFYYFIGFSGSRYKCHKKAYGFASSYGRAVLNRIIEQGYGHIEVMGNTDDWINKLKPL